MEITGKVLREVEFRDRLRGYDTDEVDEFLEEVAVAVDDLHRRLAMTGRVAATPETKERPAEPLPSFDDDSIRRTLVLAQRTADLAIREANEEATRILEESRREAQELVTIATENARRIRQDADDDFSSRVNAQLAQREQLERDVRTLGSLVNEERNRLADSLQTVLRYVTENLTIANEVTSLASSPAPSSPSAQTPAEPPVTPGAYFAPSDDVPEESSPHSDLGEVEPQVEEPLAFTAATTTSTPSTPPSTDPDEELWQRWAQSEEIGEEGNTDDADPFGFNRHP